MRLRTKTLLVFLVLLSLLFLELKNTYQWKPEKEARSGGRFTEVCASLNNQPFTFENISKLDGYIDLNGETKVSADDVNNFITKPESADKELRIYKSKWFQAASLKYSWICKIKLIEPSNTIESSATFYITD